MSKWQDFCAFLREKAPVKSRVVVRRVDMQDHGCTSCSGNGTITVTIRKQDTLNTQIETLTHEWGHVLELDTWKGHGEVWAKGYSKAYQAWEEFSG